MNILTILAPIFGFVSSLLVLIGAIFTYRSNALALKKVQKEIKELKVVVKDTQEIREALKKVLEGTWRMKGSFDKYRGEDKKHFTTGMLIFEWNPSKNYYDVVYFYSVQIENSNEFIISAFCKGILPANYDGYLDNEVNFNIDFTIESRTAKDGYNNSYAKNFTLKNGELKRNRHGKAERISFMLTTGESEGNIEILKI